VPTIHAGTGHDGHAHTGFAPERGGQVAVESSSSGNSAAPPQAPWLSYVAPMAVFMVVTALEPSARGQYPLVYTLKVALVTITLAFCRRPLRDMSFNARAAAAGAVVGAAVFLEWVCLGPLTHYPHFAFLGTRAAYDPFSAIHSLPARAMFLAARFYGLVLLVPMIEEVFWRSFLLRFVTEPDDFQRVRQGAFSWTAFIVVALAFGMAHPEWLEGIICAAAYALLLRYTRSLFACVVAHSVTNLLLGIFIVTQHAWWLW
jgi:uncharacterized protein